MQGYEGRGRAGQEALALANMAGDQPLTRDLAPVQIL
jgi:hypothetical protein